MSRIETPSRRRSPIRESAGRRRASTLAGALLLAAASLFAAQGAAAEGEDPRGLAAQDLVMMNRLGSPVVSPDGSRVVYSLRETDLEADRGRSDLWMLDLPDGQPRRLTTHEGSESGATWSPDGSSLYFLSGRSGSSQVWQLPLEGGEARQVTHLPLDVGGFLLSPDGTHLAVALEVFVECETLACTAERLDEKSASKASGLTYDRLFARHWDHWKDGRRSHLFVVDLAGKKTPVDVSRGLDADIPSKPFGDLGEATFTPDGESLVFAARDAAGEGGEPWSTNFDLFEAPVDGSAAARKITENPAWDTAPAFSPDGETLAYLAMERPGFEADRLRIVLRSWESGEERVLTQDWDRSVGSMTFRPDGKSLLVTAGDVGHVGLFEIDFESGAVTTVFRGGHVRSPSVAAGGVLFGLDTLDKPVDLYHLKDGASEPRQLTRVNSDRLAQIEMGEYEQFSFPGWNDETVYGWVVKPSGYRQGEKYPVAFLIHGGPQGSFDNDFHYRWNPQTYAGLGYAVVTIDFHGSTGYGQDFTDSITGDWGGKPLEDLQKGWAAALERYDFLDGERACALGASYGGYMINWIAGRWSDGFRCLVNHDGLFNLESFYYTTEELWFPEWEMGGVPWEVPKNYNRANPMRYVENWQTPMLVIHGALDYRVVDTEGIGAFTALQRRGIPSRLLYFPDENHWVLKPNNSIQWHEEVGAWLDRWIGPEADLEASASEASPRASRGR
ncbi:MAG: S9 family peptidase [Acidobacteriota bacterium]